MDAYFKFLSIHGIYDAMARISGKYIGTRAFYASALSIMLPIAIQNGLTNFVNLLDNVMVGRIGTEAMSGVSISNQLIFVFNLCIFGPVSGAGICSAQFFGKEDVEGIRESMRVKLVSGLAVSLLAIALFLSKGRFLISLFLRGDSNGGDMDATLAFGFSYLRIMLIGLPGFVMTQVYSSMLREGGETILPMKAGMAAIAVNLFLNWVLIFGNLGFPALGADGAAIATVISRYVEALSIIIVSRFSGRFRYMEGLYSSFRISSGLAGRILVSSLPLMLNETAWSFGMTFISQCYSTRGLNAVAGVNISTTINNLFNVTVLAMGNTIGIMIGHLLGAGKCDEAVDTDRKLIAFDLFIAAGTGIILSFIAPLFPMIYNTTEGARRIATQMILSQALILPLFAFKNGTYFTLRSGGRVIITILFDSAFLWIVGVPIAYFTSRYTSLPVYAIFLLVQAGDIIKCVIGYILVRKRIWVRRIV